ncbi:unnamed protein product [Aphanomyces euteiches]
MELTPATIAAISTATVQGDNATDACVVKLTIITDKTFLPAAFKACVAKVTNSTPRVHRFGWTDPVINAYNDSALLCQTWYTGLAHDFKTIEASMRLGALQQDASLLVHLELHVVRHL